MQRTRTPLRHATSLLAVMSMILTLMVAGATGASAHSTSSNCAKPAAEGFFDQVLDFVNVFGSFVSEEKVACPVKGENVDVKMNRDWTMPIASAKGNARTLDAPCVNGLAAGVFACDGIDLAGHVSMVEMRLGRQDIPAGVNDVWGWTDDDGRDYALLGTTEGTVFVDISTPTAPQPLGMLPTASTDGFSDWRDIKVHDDHAFIVSEHTNHGVQVFDLNRLQDHDRKKGHFVTYDMDAHYTKMGSAHNIAINEETGFAYALGSEPFYVSELPYTVAVDGGSQFLATGALFGEPLTQGGLSGTFVDTGSTGCLDEDLGNLDGAIALIDRGVCFFSDKVLNAQNSGAAGVVIISTDDEYLTMSPGETGPQVEIPSVFVTNSDGAALRAELPGTGTIFANDPPPVCGSGLHIIDVNDPKNPSYAGCEDETGYVHDTQCVIYDGPDIEHHDKELCFNSNGIGFGADAPNFFSIVDVSNKSEPEVISIVDYAGSAYSHQGWLTEDQGYFLFGDEGDELTFGVGTTTRVWDVTDLDNPFVSSVFEHSTDAIDHNIYTEGGLAYASNYEAGLRLYDASNVSDPDVGLSEVGFFDMYPEGDAPTFDGGTWSNYAYFAQSDIVVASSVDRGLFILRVHEDLLDD